MIETLTPKPSLLCKLGSIVVHVEELLSPSGHPADKAALDTLLTDPEVRYWLSAMQAGGYLPVKR